MARFNESTNRLVEEILKTSSSQARSKYTVVGFKKSQEEKRLVGDSLMPITSTPGKAVETAIRLNCYWITVTSLAGRLDLARALVKFEETRPGESGHDEFFDSFPVSRPPPNFNPKVISGHLTYDVVGVVQILDGSTTVVWENKDSDSPVDDVARAIEDGSTEVTVKVGQGANIQQVKRKTRSKPMIN